MSDLPAILTPSEAAFAHLPTDVQHVVQMVVDRVAASGGRAFDVDHIDASVEVFIRAYDWLRAEMKRKGWRVRIKGGPQSFSFEHFKRNIETHSLSVTPIR